MSSPNHHALALEALRVSAQHIEELQRENEALEHRILLAHAPQLVADLATMLGEKPLVDIGHLDAVAFERVRERLDVAPSDIDWLSNTTDGRHYFIIQCERAGVRIRAQRYADTTSRVGDAIPAIVSCDYVRPIMSGAA